MSPLETLLRPAIAMVNRQIAAKTPARALCDELAGRCMAIRVRDTALALYLTVGDGVLVPKSDYDADPDVAITGSLLSLGSLAGPDGESMVRGGDIDITGDAIVAQQFQKLLRYGRPDLEEELSTLVGDAAAHRIGEIVRGVGRWGNDARDTLRQNLGEYLQEESRVAPTRYEVEELAGHISELRDGVERFEAKLKQLESRLGGAGAQ